MTSPARATRGLGPVPYRARQRILALSRQMKMGHRAEDERAAAMRALHEEGYSFDAIAEAAGVTREMVRKAILRRSAAGYGPDAVARGRSVENV